MWRLHRGIGMGGDQFVAHVAGDDVEAEHGDDLREAWTEEFDRLIGEVRPFDQARELLVGREAARASGWSWPARARRSTSRPSSTSSTGRSVAEAWTTSDDVENSKPAPDLVATALDRVDGASGVMVGDSPFDCEAAGRLSVPTLAVLTGGFSREELTDAGASTRVRVPRRAAGRLDDTPLSRPEA